MPTNYTIQLTHYSDGTTTQIAVDAQGLPLVPQPDLSNSQPCPPEQPNINVPATDTSGLATEQTLQSVLTALQTDPPCCNETVLANILTALQMQNNLLSVWNAAIPQLLNPPPPVNIDYKTVAVMVGLGGVGATFSVPANAVAFSAVSLEFDPAMNPYTPTQRLGDAVVDPNNGVLPLALVGDYRVEETRTPSGTLQQLGVGYTIQSTAGGAVLLSYKIPM